MDSTHVLVVAAALSSAILLVRSLRSRMRGWSVVSGLIVLAAGAGWALRLPQADVVTCSLWAVFVVLPLAGQRFLGTLSDRQRYGAAARLAAVLRLLHPADGWWDRPRFFLALDLGRRGQLADAAALLEQLEQGSSVFAREAAVHRLRMQSRWEDVLAWIEESAPALGDGAALLPMRLRALGETGDLEGLCARYAAAEPLFARAEHAGRRNVCRLFTLAFTGRSARVAALYDGLLASAPPALRAFWLATADLAASPGDAAAIERLEALLEQGDPSLRSSVERRLERPPAAASSLSPAARAVIARIERELDLEARYGDRPGSVRGALVTLGLMIPSIGMFVAEELLGGSTNGDTLYALGAVWPDAVLAGGWWRLGAATVLHYGYLHLGMNMAGLWVLGRYVEFALGRIRYVLVYLFTGVFTMLLVVLLSRAGMMEPQLLVGASGGIMGLVGATGAVLLRGMRTERSALARRRLLGVGLIVLAQTAFDLATPEVSFLSHFGGFVLGFLLAAVLPHRVTPKTA